MFGDNSSMRDSEGLSEYDPYLGSTTSSQQGVFPLPKLPQYLSNTTSNLNLLFCLGFRYSLVGLMKSSTTQCDIPYVSS